jgi:hypothetical protein
MKVESQDGRKITYVDIVAGRECRATTANGPQAAERIFAIIRGQNGVAKSGPAPIVPTTKL